MSRNQRKETFSFSDAELAVAAMHVRETMLNSLPEPEECKREFSVSFEQKMKKLIAKEKAMRTIAEIKRWVLAVLILVFVSSGTVLMVDTEARAAFVDWVRRVYENSIIYEFFNEPTAEKLPAFELGWVPEGYEVVYTHQNDKTHSAVYQKGDDVNDVFVFEYGYKHSEGIIELHGDTEKYTVTHEVVADKAVDLYISENEKESNVAIWVDEGTGVVLKLNCYFNQAVILNIIENIFLVK